MPGERVQMEQAEQTWRAIDLCLVRQVRIGAGIMPRAAADCRAAGATSAFIVTSAPIAHLADALRDDLLAGGMACTVWAGPDGEPTVAHFLAARQAAEACGADFVFGLGGGSALDVAKLVAALLRSDQSFADCVGIGLLVGRALPLACIPTTAGTGSEVTPIAILEDEDAQLKKGVVSPFLVPDYAYLDAELTVSMPGSVTAATGIDALTHCIEAYTNRFAHPLVDSWALEGIRLVGESLLPAIRNPGDLAARQGMLLASHLGGLCLGPVNTAAVHALAYPLGGEFHVPHGVANALLLPHVMRFNIPAAPARYAAVAHALGVAPTSDALHDAEAGIAAVEHLSEQAGIHRRLTQVGVGHNALPRMAEAAMTVQRLLNNNPRPVTQADALSIYEAAL
jgi:alcohol dehydrogenase class IV